MKQQNKFRKTSPPICSRLWRLMLLVALLLPAWEGVKGAQVDLKSTTSYSMNQGNTLGFSDKTVAAMRFKIPFYDEYGVIEWWQEFSIRAQIGNGGYFNVAYISVGSSSQGVATSHTCKIRLENGNWRASVLNNVNSQNQISVLEALTGTFSDVTINRENVTEGEGTCYLDVIVYMPAQENVTYSFDINGEYARKDRAGSVNTEVPLNGQFTSPTLSVPTLHSSISQTAGFYSVSYTNASTSSPIQVKWSNASDFVNVSGNSTDVAISDSEQSFGAKFRFQYNEKFTLDKDATAITLPAFHQANSFKAEDVAGGNTKLTWSIANSPTPATYQSGDNFEIQRALNSSFSDAVSIMSVGEGKSTVPFDINKSSYEITDATGALGVNGSVYYRIRRTKQSSWNWDLYQKTNIMKTMHHRGVQSANASLTADKGAVNITWTLEDNTSNAVVTTDNSTITILRVDSATNNKEYIQLPMDKTSYTDNNMSMCSSYKYYVYVTPGTKKYDPTTQIAANTIGLVPALLASITSLTASKGYYSSYTRITWTTDGKASDQFRIERKPTSETVFTTVGTVDGEKRIYDDISGSAGTLYDYRVVSYSNCSSSQPNISSLVRGFRSPTGSVDGQVTFTGSDNGEANVNILVSGTTSDNGRSYELKGSTDSYLETDSVIPNPDYATIQMFVKPTVANQKVQLVSWGRFVLSLNDGKVTFSANGGTNYLTSPTALPIDRFSQLTATYSSDSLRLYIDSALVTNLSSSGNVGVKKDVKVKIGKELSGYVDEIRLWNRPLQGKTAAGMNEIEQTCSRLLAGDEEGLTAYWRLNDNVSDEFYDISFHGETYNAYHGKVYNASSTAVVPTENQLALRGVTDATGYYYISGIPYVGDGSKYKLVPSYPNHSFSPNFKYISINGQISNVSNMNFTDNSSINISGYVFYQNSSIPVNGANFQIDGVTVTSDGKFVESDPDGSFTFNVPVGTHIVKAVKANHTFVNEGRLTNSNGVSLNYQQPMANLRFWDQTKVKLVGRMVGGVVEGNKPIGFSLSKNNLGDKPQMVLSLEGDNASKIYDKGAVYKNGVLDNAAPDKMDSTMTHYRNTYHNTVFYRQDSIVINPDEKTGEYVALLYPVKYKVTGASVTGWTDLIGTSAPVIDLTNTFAEQTSTYVDSITTTKKDTLKYKYNEDFSIVHRVQPTISYQQGNEYGYKSNFFGMETYVVSHIDGSKPDTLNLYDSKTKKYLFGQDLSANGLPVFEVGTWGLWIKATENYTYNGTKATGTITIDKVPTSGGDVEIHNMFYSTNPTVKAQLNDKGELYFQFGIDKPKTTIGNIGKMDISVVIDKSTFTAPQLRGFIIGSDPDDGKDFVTSGPIKLLNILRDPPGSASYSWWESGQTYSYTATRGNGFVNSGSETEQLLLGMEEHQGTGALAAFTMWDTESQNNISAGVEHEETTNYPETNTISITTNSRYQTSDDPSMVGADADVFIGYSNNIFYGLTRNVSILDAASYNGLGDKQKSNFESVTVNGKTYYMCVSRYLSFAPTISTLFSYPKSHIEKQIIPNLTMLRNNMLMLDSEYTGDQADKLAKKENRVVYLSHLSPDDPAFGSNNTNSTSDGNSYTAYLPADSLVKKLVSAILWGKDTLVANGTPDSIYYYNMAINEWKRVLKQNEDEKLAAMRAGNLVDQNRSFHASAPVEYSESFSAAKEDSYEYSFMASALVIGEMGFEVAGLGFKTTGEEHFGGTGTYSQTSGKENTSTAGFTLADEGDFDYLSVDVLRSAPVDTSFQKIYNDTFIKLTPDSAYVHQKMDTARFANQYGNFVFRTRGGATSCPYEPEEYTTYQVGSQQKLSDGTVQVEVPYISADTTVVSNVPSDQAAIFNLKLMNNTKASGVDAVFTIAMADSSNQKGAKFSIDGVPLAEGRGIQIPYGEVINKVLEIRRGTEYDYNNLTVILKSQCDDNIASTVQLSAHFIPSSSDINISSPTDKWTLNTNSPMDLTSGKYYMPLTVDGFNVNYTGFDHIELQYKASSDADTKWTTICSYFTDSAKYNAASGVKAMINGATISDNFFGADDQKYDIRAVSFSKVGNDFVTKTSAILSGTKDTKRPTVFGNLEPADGVLDVEDNIKMTFNEEIAEGIMTNVKNFEVTGIVNGTNTDHSTSLTFDGKASYLATQAERNLEGKDVTVEMWVMPTSLGKKMTLFSHGTAAQALELSIAADNTIEVNINGNSYKSAKAQAFKVNEWAHVAMTYNAATKQLVAYFGGDDVLNVTASEYKGTGIMNFGRGIGGSNYFAGKMHEARVWNKVITPDNIIANKLTIYTGQELGMMDYYPMNEGKGTTVTDKAQGATAWINGATWSTLDGMSLAFDGAKTYAKVNTSSIAIDKEMNYSLEFWFKAAANQTNAAIVSNGSSDVTGLDKVFVGFQNGKLIFSNNGHKETIEGSWMDDAWHHFAISVNRNAGNAQIFMDGALKNYFDANLLGGLAASYLNLGAIATTDTANVEKGSSFFKGQIDELQLWDMALPSTYIKDKYNVCPKGKEMGLMAYLPFSKYITNTANAQEMVYSGEDLVSNKPLVTLVGADTTSIATTAKAPVKAKGPEVSLKFSFVVNKDALVINLLDSPEALEKTTVNITVKDVTDLNGNQMLSPVTWSAYINQNQLKWSETSITKEKKLDAAMSFTVDAMNTGGTEKNFTINNLPSWLTATPSSGTIDPLGKQTITFTVKPGTAIGHYDDVVYLTGENKVSESLSLTLKVFDNQPDWTPVEGKYSMNVYGRIRVEDVFSIDEEDMLGAFDGNGKCVGKATNQYMQVNDMWYVFMTVYSDTTSINNLSFRIWDASSGTVYSATPSEALVFSIDKVYGKISAPIVFSANTGIVQNISLKKGWNWVSFNVQSSNLSSVSNLMSGLKLDGDEQVKSDAAGTFSAYTGNSGKWIGTSGSFDNKHMYLLQSNYIQTLSIPGTLLTSDMARTITLNKGWNYISYIPNSNLSIAEALSGYAATDGDIIKTQNSFSMYGGNVGWVGNLTFMQPGVGYMLQSAKGGKLVYPDMTTKSVTTKSDGEAAENVWTELSYETNMSIVATVAENLPLEPGDKLQAYSNGKLRGEAMVTDINSPLYFLTVGGTDNASVSFALERGGQIIGKTSPMFDYNPNNVFGSIQQPLIIDFLNDLEISVYPNPFENELNFSMNVKTGDKIRIQLFAMNGRLLHDYGTTATSSGYWHYRWDSSNFTVSSLYMAVVIINGEKHVYKVIRK